MKRSHSQLSLLPAICMVPALLAWVSCSAADAPAPGAMPMPSAADQAMMTGMRRMQQQMAAAPMTGDPDHDFVAMMTPHHAGAIDMAKVELRYGHDPELRRLAQDIIAAQQREIVRMNAWMSEHPTR